MIVRGFSFFFIIALLISCQNRYRVPEPEKLIEEEKFINILTDMMILDAAANVSDVPLKKNDISSYQFLSEKYDIDSVQLKENLAYYNSQFDENLEIYKLVKEKIEAKRQALDEKKEDSTDLKK